MKEIDEAKKGKQYTKKVAKQYHNEHMALLEVKSEI
jgi:hypothetical protein